MGYNGNADVALIITQQCYKKNTVPYHIMKQDCKFFWTAAKVVWGIKDSVCCWHISFHPNLIITYFMKRKREKKENTC